MDKNNDGAVSAAEWVIYFFGPVIADDATTIDVAPIKPLVPEDFGFKLGLGKDNVCLKNKIGKDANGDQVLDESQTIDAAEVILLFHKIAGNKDEAVTFAELFAYFDTQCPQEAYEMS